VEMSGRHMSISSVELPNQSKAIMLRDAFNEVWTPRGWQAATYKGRWISFRPISGDDLNPPKPKQVYEWIQGYLAALELPHNPEVISRFPDLEPVKKSSDDAPDRMTAIEVQKKIKKVMRVLDDEESPAAIYVETPSGYAHNLGITRVIYDQVGDVCLVTEELDERKPVVKR
jgi:hypothetical protein